MLHGTHITLRPVRSADLDAMYAAHTEIVPENAASRRIAEKCGFALEGTVRGAFFNDGRNQDVLLHSLLRDDPRPWQGAAAGN